jgi:Glycosyltransferase family 87/WD40-like Beta Propeller Repeat
MQPLPQDTARAAPETDVARTVDTTSWLPALEWGLLGLLVALFLWRGFWPAWRSLNTDFPNSYLAAICFREGCPLERLYDQLWLQRIKDHAGLDQDFVGYVPLTMFSALVVAPLAWLPALEAKRVWLIVNLFLLLGVGLVLKRLTRLSPRRIALVLFLAIVPLRNNFAFGQQYVLLLFLISLAALFYFQGRSLGAGLVLAAAAALKLYPALFALALVRKRQGRALLGLAGGGIALALLALALFGWEPLRVYVAEVLPRAVGRGEVIDPYSTHLISFAGLFRRLFVYEPELNPHPALHAPALFVVLQSLAVASVVVAGLGLLTPRRAEPAQEKLDWGMITAFFVLASSGAATYHLCLLVLAAALALDTLLAAGRPRHAALVLVALALVGLPYERLVPQNPEGWRSLLAYPRLYVVLGFCLLLWSAQRALRGGQAPGGRRDTLALAVGLAAWTIAGSLSGWHHLRSELAELDRRIPTRAYVAADPVVVGTEVYFSRMSAHSYVLDRTGDRLDWSGRLGWDLFHPAATPAEKRGWVEIAGPGRSRIARFPLATRGLSDAELTVEMEDAEQPSVSRDGRWLGFLRRDRGRASLWLVDRHGATENDREPRLLAAAGREVLDFNFSPEGDVVFAAWRDGRARLYRARAPDGSPSELVRATRGLRYPAISPDGRWLAYSEDEDGDWQLWVSSLPDGERRQLTHGECNAVMAAWYPDARRLVYATDCARGLGNTALAQVSIDSIVSIAP